MPNTLAHIGVQAWTGPTVFKETDFRWVFLGLCIPDLPWIFQRVVRTAITGIDLYDLRAYCIVQASFFGCLFLCAAVALVTRRAKRIFLVLSANVLFHLLLDATQIKWANGVHLWAPFTWRPMGFGWFWPEAWPSFALTLLGVGFFPVFLKYHVPKPKTFRWKPLSRLLASFFFLGAYFFVPILLIKCPYTADNHFIRTLKDKGRRMGKPVEIDRNEFLPTPRGPVLKTCFKEEIRLIGAVPEHAAKISLKGRFSDQGTIHVVQFHVHSRLRDIFSLLGLGWVFLTWTDPLTRGISFKK